MHSVRGYTRPHTAHTGTAVNSRRTNTHTHMSSKRRDATKEFVFSLSLSLSQVRFSDEDNMNPVVNKASFESTQLEIDSFWVRIVHSMNKCFHVIHTQTMTSRSTASRGIFAPKKLSKLPCCCCSSVTIHRKSHTRHVISRGLYGIFSVLLKSDENKTKMR